jgi:hypothetical protein
VPKKSAWLGHTVRALRFLADARSVVAHVALHHDLAIFVELRDAERTGDHTVAARNASWLPRRLHDAVTGSLDGIGRTYSGARRLFAVHAHDRYRLHAFRPADVLEVNHRFTSVRVAFGARLHAGLAADAPVRIYEEMQIVGLGHGADPSYCCGFQHRGILRWRGGFAEATATDLVLRILLIGSCAATVT